MIGVHIIEHLTVGTCGPRGRTSRTKNARLCARAIVRKSQSTLQGWPSSGHALAGLRQFSRVGYLTFSEGSDSVKPQAEKASSALNLKITARHGYIGSVRVGASERPLISSDSMHESTHTTATRHAPRIAPMVALARGLGAACRVSAARLRPAESDVRGRPSTWSETFGAVW